MSTSTDTFRGAGLLTLLGVLVLRCSVALFSYSGEKTPPMHGDYEAQRHWMEITHNLPTKEWYFNTSRNDLMYWGLDYPPLTAYHSKLFGYIASLIDQDFVALGSSRGYESYVHKLFMRSTVIISDLCVYIPAVWLYFTQRPWPCRDSALVWIFLALSHPSLLLIDHGHFQYNSVSLGFTIFALAALYHKGFLLGSILFVLSLSFKQMSLYHALPFFCFLLGQSLSTGIFRAIPKLFAISCVVVLTFTLVWFPFLSDIRIISQVLTRLFPLARGVFEDKVSNMWCTANIIFKFKTMFSNQEMALVCMIATVIAVLPSCMDFLFSPNRKKLVYALINSALSFFLFSFQVHEKSILLAAVPAALALPTDPFMSMWFITMSTFSMLPLLIKDGLFIPFVALTIFHLGAITLMVDVSPGKELAPPRRLQRSQRSNRNIHKEETDYGIFYWAAFAASMTGCVVLAVFSYFMQPPDQYPDLFPLLTSVYACVHFVMFLMYFNYKQFLITADFADQEYAMSQCSYPDDPYDRPYTIRRYESKKSK